ncbi:MAG TPA: tetratricopeptide repeat protein [Blastocatellia bacterium]|nr:tetratricopeptide repeat protein [Blastocatellia bacterium]
MSLSNTGIARAEKKRARSRGRVQSQSDLKTPVEQTGWLMMTLERLSPARVFLLLCLASLLAYGNSLGGDFVFDDTEQIVDNVDIRSWDNLGKAFTTHVWAFRERPEALRVPVPPPYYRPLFTVLFTIGYQLFGLWPQGWHLLSLLLHMLCSMGVYYVLLQLSDKKPVAWIAAMVFAVIPIHSESVSWISGVTDPLFSVFFLASFYLYMKFRAGGKGSHLALSLLMFACSAFSKEPGLSLILLLFLYEIIKPSETKTSAARLSLSSVLAAAFKTLPFAAVGVVYLAARYMVLGGLTWRNPHAYEGPAIDVLLTLPWVIATYISHLLWPFNLSIAYNSSFVTEAASARFLVPVLILAAGFSALVYFRKKIGREVWFALAIFFVPILPVLDLRQLSVEYLIFDRYLYLSVAGYGYLLGLGLMRLASSNILGLSASRRAAITTASLAVLLVGFTAATARENRSWNDSYSLWSNAARIRPEFWAAHYNAALALMEMKRYGEAREMLDRAARIAPGEPFIFDALGRTSDAMGDAQSAIENFKRALALEPTMFESLNNLGTVYFKAGDYEAAEAQFRLSLKQKPQAVASRFNLALCYSKRGRYEEAKAELDRALEYAPEDAEILYELGLAQEKLGRRAEAAATLRRSLALSRNHSLTDKVSESLNRLEQTTD